MSQSPVKQIYKGYSQNNPEHMNPAQCDQITQIDRIIANRTQLEKSLRYIIKQRLFGKLLVKSHSKTNSYSQIRQINTSQIPKLLPINPKKCQQMQSYKSKSKQKIKNIQLKKSIHQSRLDTIKNNRYSLNQSRIEKVKIEILPLKQQKQIKNFHLDKFNYQPSSFISAIQINILNTFTSKNFIVQQKDFQIFPKLSKVKQKDKQSIVEQVSKQIWNLFTVTDSSKKDKRNASQTDRNIHSIILYANVLVQRKVIHKQNYIKYLKNISQRFFIRLINYFQIKIWDGMANKQYQKVLKGIKQSDLRLWLYLIFQYWDLDRNGLISSNDLFKLFTQLDQKNKKLTSNESSKQNLFITNNLNLIIIQKIRKFIKLFIECINKLNSLIIINNQMLQNQVEQIQKNSYTLDNQKFNQLLEEAIIQNHQSKVKQVQQLIGSQINKNKHYIKQQPFFSKNISIKFSSCYRNSFISNDHNQQTRFNRQKIQNIKQNLKLLRKNRKIINGEITYQQFSKESITKKIVMQIKQLTLQILGLLVS